MKKIKCNTLLEPNEISVNFYISPKYSFFWGGAAQLYEFVRNLS